MRLKEFIKQNNLTIDAFASMGGFSRGAVLKWVSGDRFPRPLTLKKIKAITQGAVTPNDFETK